MSESTLMDVPAGVVAFHMDMNEPRVPGKIVFIVYVFRAQNLECIEIFLGNQKYKYRDTNLFPSIIRIDVVSCMTAQCICTHVLFDVDILSYGLLLLLLFLLGVPDFSEYAMFLYQQE
jgi:hypothetical protein